MGRVLIFLILLTYAPKVFSQTILTSDLEGSRRIIDSSAQPALIWFDFLDSSNAIMHNGKIAYPLKYRLEGDSSITTIIFLGTKDRKEENLVMLIKQMSQNEIKIQYLGVNPTSTKWNNNETKENTGLLIKDKAVVSPPK